MVSPYLQRQLRTEAEATAATDPLGDGPFLVVERVSIFNGDGQFIASASPVRAPALAARLTAFDDMLAALRDALVWLAQDDTPQGEVYATRVRNAIAKAEGRS